MSVFRRGLALAAVAVLLGVLGVGAGGVGASTPVRGSAFNDEFEPPDHDADEPAPVAAAELEVEVSNWSWPGVYDSAFRIDYTVTNTGNVRLDGFGIGETNADRIVSNCEVRALDPGRSYSCTALLYQTVNPQTVQTFLTATTDGTFFIADIATTTYIRFHQVDDVLILDVADGGLSDAG